MLGRTRWASSRRTARFLAMPMERRRTAIETACRGVLERNWVATPGFTMPNRRKYPWQWLWDSCFHAIAWSALGDARCSRELENVFALQLSSGFVPHMGYHAKPDASLALWSSRGRSDITQPPMYGHALRVLSERGFAVDHLYDGAAAGLRYLLEHRRDPGSGLIRVVHPWETGCDDSPRWDGWDTGRFSERRWNARKRELVGSLRLRDGAAWANPGFEVASVGFSALVAFNARELAELTGDAYLRSRASALADATDARWDQARRTWVDVRVCGPDTAASARTLDALLGVLISASDARVEAGFTEIFEPRSFWRSMGPSGTAADEPTYDPSAYWRGDAWPQMIYLIMIAARRRGYREATRRLAERLVLGCVAAGFSERWNPETGRRLGAAPQGWAALATEGVLVTREE